MNEWKFEDIELDGPNFMECQDLLEIYKKNWIKEVRMINDIISSKYRDDYADKNTYVANMHFRINACMFITNEEKAAFNLCFDRFESLNYHR